MFTLPCYHVHNLMYRCQILGHLYRVQILGSPILKCFLLYFCLALMLMQHSWLYNKVHNININQIQIRTTYHTFIKHSPLPINHTQWKGKVNLLVKYICLFMLNCVVKHSKTQYLFSLICYFDLHIVPLISNWCQT